jgi:riboflavin synthase
VFTGIVDDRGVLESAVSSDAGIELCIACGYDALQAGESIAVNGVCLTIREHGAGWFTAGVVGTTLERTTISGWFEGQQVNLERALRAGDRMGGHIVQGHVDGVATVVRIGVEPDRWLIDIALPDGMAELMVPMGALAVDGVSLTVNALPSPGVVQISLIEYTRAHTALGSLREGDRVHIECDIIGKYVQRLLSAHLQETRS